MPRVEVDPSISKAFSAEFSTLVEISGGLARIEESALLEVVRVKRGVLRTYGQYLMTPEQGGRFYKRAQAFFDKGSRLPEMTVVSVDQNRRLRLPFRSTDMDNMNMLVIQGNDLRLSQDNNGVSVTAHINRLHDRLERISIRVGKFHDNHEFVSSGIIDSIPEHKANPDVYLRDHGVFRDVEAGSIELRTRSGWTVSGKTIVPTEDILTALYPEELRNDHFGAPSEFDGWAQEDMFEAFGIIISGSEAAVVPIVEQSTEVQPQ